MTASSIDLSYDATLREIPTPDGILRYHEAGEGTPLLFLHGSGPGVTGWRNFRGVLPSFAEPFRCLVLEFPGYGVSDDFGGHPVLTAQGAVVSFVEEMGLERVDIIGNSMGGGVGINLGNVTGSRSQAEIRQRGRRSAHPHPSESGTPMFKVGLAEQLLNTRRGR